MPALRNSLRNTLAKEYRLDERVGRLRTPEECEQFAINVEVRLPDLARAALRRAVELRAASHSANTQTEKDALEAIYAYEHILFKKHRKKVHAQRTRQMISKHGIIETVERVVKREGDASGYVALAEAGMHDKSFESVVMRHPESFTDEAVQRCRERQQKWALSLGSIETAEPNPHG